MTGLRILNEIMDPATREASSRGPCSRSCAGAHSGHSGCTRHAAYQAKPEGSHEHSHSTGALSRPQGPRCAEPCGGMELYQSLHAVWEESRLQRQFRQAAARSRREGARPVPSGGRSEALGGGFYQSEGGVAVFRGGTRRQLHPLFCAQRDLAAAHVPFQPPSQRRWAMFERLCPRCGGRPPRSRSAVCCDSGRRDSRTGRGGQDRPESISSRSHC